MIRALSSYRKKGGGKKDRWHKNADVPRRRSPPGGKGAKEGPFQTLLEERQKEKRKKRGGNSAGKEYT